MAESNYWVWCNEPSSEDDMYIEGTPTGIEDNNLEFDNGMLVSTIVPEITLRFDDEAEGTMTDHIVAPGAKGLLMTTNLVKILRNSGADNLQDIPINIHDINGNLVSDKYRIVNIIGCIKAVDLEASNIEMHPDSPDQIEFINSLVLREPIAGDPLIFRLAENTQVVIAHNKLKNAIEENGMTGIKFSLPEDYFI